MAIDPVCGMEVDTASATFVSEYKGETYYFCSPGCKRDFDNQPEHFIRKDDDPGQHPLDARNVNL